MAENRNAGKHPSYKGWSPSSIQRKIAYDKRYHQTRERKQYRAELNRENRKRGTYGNGDGMDVSHTKGGTTKLELQRLNRSRNGRGGRNTKA
jgi:hypothetical protein